MTLPNSRLVVQYATKYFTLVKDGPGVFEPDVIVRTPIAAWLAGNDPALETAIAHR